MSGAGQQVHCCHAELHRKSSCYAVEYRSFVGQGVVVDWCTLVDWRTLVDCRTLVDWCTLVECDAAVD